MTKAKNYKKTLISCYLGFITQAITANFAPLLFLTFQDSFGISLEKIALIPLVFYVTQLFVDLVAMKLSDRIGYRISVVVSQAVSALGLLLMAFLPGVLPDPFVGILIAVVLYAVGSGLVEVLLSPIVEACPFENKAGVMSLLHSFYCWGAVAVIFGSTLFFAVFGIKAWRILTILWAAVPLVNTVNFLFCPIERLVEDGEGMRVRDLLKTPVFLLMIVLMIAAGASEVTMAQWASAFTESALGISKTVGDLLGPCLFAVFMGVARTFYGKMSGKVNLNKVMILSAVLCLICYLTSALAPVPMIGLLGCAACGLSVGIMWPGTISISAKNCPKGGTAMFALLALAGDLGAAAGPSAVGKIADESGGNLKIGLLSAVVFPIIMIVGLILLFVQNKKNSR